MQRAAAAPRQLGRPRISPATCSNVDAAAASTSGRASENEIAAAWNLLKAFSAAQFRGLSQQYVATPDARAKLRDALLLAYENPSTAEGWGAAGAGQSGSEVLMGVCASDSRLGLRALRDWCQALQLEYVMPDCKVTGVDSIAAVTGAVYIKYNAMSKFCYLAEYKGSERGVLVQLGQGPMLGHFPLGLFDEAMSNPEPAMKAPAASGSGSS